MLTCKRLLVVHPACNTAVLNISSGVWFAWCGSFFHLFLVLWRNSSWFVIHYVFSFSFVLVLKCAVSASHLLPAVLTWGIRSLWSIHFLLVKIRGMNWGGPSRLTIRHIDLSIISTNWLPHKHVLLFSYLIYIWRWVLLLQTSLLIVYLLTIKFFRLIKLVLIRAIRLSEYVIVWRAKHPLVVLASICEHLHGWNTKSWADGLTTVRAGCADTCRCWHWL